MKNTFAKQNSQNFPFLIACVFLLGACSEKSLEWSGSSSNSINGTVAAIYSQSAAAACAEPTASIFKLDSSGAKVIPSLQKVPVTAQGAFSFSDISKLGIKTNGKKIEGSYVAVIDVCNTSYARILTSTDLQLVDWGSTLISYLIGTPQSSNVAKANPEKLTELYLNLSVYSDFSSAYAALSTNVQLRQQFQDLMGASPTILQDAAPTASSINVPKMMREGEAAALSILATQWSPSYNFAYLWKKNGVTIATTNNANYTPDANAQGLHVITVFWGQQDSNGHLDTTKPFQSQSFNVSIENTTPALPPVMTAVANNINTSTVSLQLSTGGSQANCASFSKLVVTEDDVLAPLLPSAYTISCTQSPLQSLSFNLSGGYGSHVLRLWAIDSAGNVSATSRAVSVTYSNAYPSLSFTSPAANAAFQGTVSLTGSCDQTAGDVSITGDVTAATTPCASGIFNKAIILSGADGAKTINVAQTNSFGNTGSAVLNLMKDNVAPTLLALTTSPLSPGKITRPNVSGTTEAAASVKLYAQAACGGSVVANGIADGAGAFTLIPASSIGADGNYSFSALSTDAAGNTVCSAAATVYTLDTLAPTVTFSSAAPTNTNVTPIPVTVVFSEAVTGFNSASMTLTNATVSGFSGSGTTYSFNAIPSAQGVMQIALAAGTAQDSAGNGNNASNTLVRTFDNVAPALSIASPTAGGYVNSTTVTVTGACETGLNIAVGGSGVANPIAAVCSSSAFSFTMTLTNGDGLKNISLTQTDDAGNATTAARALSLDTVAPSLAFTSTAIQNQNTNGATVTFTGTCESGINVVVGGGVDSSSTVCTSGAWTYTTAAQSGDATRSYTFKQTDTAGNSTTITGSWVRDSVAPALTFASPAAGTSAQTSITLTGACESGLPIVFSGSGLLSDVTSTCSGSSYSQLVYFSSGDGSKSMTVKQTDLAGNSTPITRSFNRDTVAPAITQATRTSPYYSGGNSATFGGVCETGISIVVSGADSSSIPCSAGSWSYTTSAQTTDGSRMYTFTQSDSAANSGAISAVWVRDTLAPTLTFTSNSNFLTSGNTVTFVGTCESGLNVVVSGSASATIACSAGAWNYAATNSSDGAYNYTFKETDLAGNLSTINGSWTRSTAGPTITITQNTPQVNGSSTQTISGTCTGGTAGSNGIITVSGAQSTTVSCSSTTSAAGTWSFAATKSVDGNYDYTFTTTDNFTTPRSSSASLTWQRDSAPPVVTASTFSINGGANSTSAVSYNPVSFSASDNLTFVTKFCLKNSSSAPSASDGCWYPVNGSGVGVTPANSIAISNYAYNIGIVPQTYQVYLWLMDGAGNISVNSGTSGTDMVNITLSPITPPAVSNVLASNSDTMNAASSERMISAGADVFLRWTASGSSLSASPISLYFTVDDLTWTPIASGLANGQNNCTSLQGTGSAATLSTGCYKWSGGSPSSNYYKIRVSATNTLGASTFATSLPINAGSLQIIAGNTETGINGSANSAVFQASYSATSQVDTRSLVVNSKGVIYFRDITLGLLTVNPSDGKLVQLIPATATTSGVGDGGSITSAQLRKPLALAIDNLDRLLILDYDRIRRIDFSTNPGTITTLIGGGISTADTVTTATNVKLTANATYSQNSFKLLLNTAPNGDIYFYSESAYMLTAKRMRIYQASTGTVLSLYPSGSISTLSSTPGYTVTDFTKCGTGFPLMEFSQANGALTNLYFMMVFHNSYTGCTSPAYPAGSSGQSIVKFNAATGVADSSQIPTAYYQSGAYAGNADVVPALDGKMYVVDRNRAWVQRFDASSNSWTTIVGIGYATNCADGTTATSCGIDPGGAFVDAQSRLYFMDRGRVRTIQNGNIVTLYGQSFSFGDSGLAINARFGNTQSVGQRSDSKIIVFDNGVGRMRLFNRNGPIGTIAGNDTIGGSGVTTAAPATSVSMPNVPASYNFLVDPSDNIIFPEPGNVNWRRLPATYATNPTATYWATIKDTNNQGIFTGSTLYYTMAANGASAGSISISALNDSRFYGGHDNTVLFMLDQYSAGYINNIFGEVDLTTGIYKINVGPTSGSGAFCADGTAVSACTTGGFNGYSSSIAGYDSVNSTWLLLSSDNKTVRSFGTGLVGNFGTPAVFTNAAATFIYKRFPGNSHGFYYYCSSANGKIYIKDETTGTESALNWPISSIKCSGTQMTYDTTTDSILFPFTQNGLSGVAEVLNAHPSSNGM